MTAGLMRLGVVGAGRVFERLYGPALGRVDSIALVAVCDVQAPDHALPPGVHFHSSLAEMLAVGGIDSVAVLTPPRLHAEQARAVLAAGLRVLVEKPVAMDLAEMRGVLDAGHDLTPAFPRRYWPSYRGLAAGVTRLELETSPEAWGARDGHKEDAAFDLLPHLVDLARAAKGGAPVGVTGTRTASGADAALRFEDGSMVRCRAAHGAEYREWYMARGKPRRVGPPGFARTLMGRLRREPPVDVSGMAALLGAWAGNSPEAPGMKDAWDSVAAVDAYWRSVGSGQEEAVERWSPHR